MYPSENTPSPFRPPSKATPSKQVNAYCSRMSPQEEGALGKGA